MIDTFLSKARLPLVVVGTLPEKERAGVRAFLEKLEAPLIVEGVSGLREEPSLQKYRVLDTPTGVDCLLRIGGVPTASVWRRQESSPLPALSVSHLPFLGSDRGELIIGAPGELLERVNVSSFGFQRDESAWMALERRLEENPQDEEGMMRRISLAIPKRSHVFLGNSLPIRTWDLAATSQPLGFDVQASRGLNGIDGQVATFLGMCTPERDNVLIVGDLTLLYDLAGFWGMRGLARGVKILVIVMNNGGGQIFAKRFQEKSFLCSHGLSFEPVARLWGLEYAREERVPSTLTSGAKFLELSIK